MPGDSRTLEQRPPSLAAAFGDAREALVRAWPHRLAEADPGSAPVDPAEAAEVVDAVAAALDDDLAPLIACLGLGSDAAEADAARMVDRVDAALRRVEAVHVAARDVVRATPSALDPAMATIARQLAVQATATLAFRAAAAAERARSGTESLAVTVHELRRPLTVVSSYAQLLNAGTLGELDERVASSMRAVLAASEVMLRLVESLAALTRLEDPTEPSDLVEVGIDEIIGGAVAEASTEAELRDVGVDVEAAPGLRLRADRERLVLAVTNLLSNAVKHSPPGSRVVVSAAADGDVIALRVRDHGPGFTAQTAARLFEKYYRDPEERSRGVAGTGLGLYIVQTVAERHGGTVAARPAEGGGAEFELRLPRR